MCITIGISENGREKLGLAISVIDAILALFGIVLISLALYMNVQLDSKMHLMDGYDTGTIPYFLMVVSVLMILLNALCAKVAFDSAYPETRSRFQNILVLLLGLKFVLIWLIFAGSLLCFTHTGVIHESLKNGMTSVMKQYKNNLPYKLTIDEIQLEYKCCGSNGYTDWFTINWVNEDYINVKHPAVLRKLKNGKYIHDDVPFSCCNVNLLRPCVHHDVRNKSMHMNYAEVTLYKHGCAGKLMAFYENVILIPTGWSVLLSFFLQFLTLILMRFLQTSISDACDMETPLGLGVGYMFPNCPCDCCRTGDPMKYVKRGRVPDEIDEEDELDDYSGFGNQTNSIRDQGVDERGDIGNNIMNNDDAEKWNSRKEGGKGKDKGEQEKDKINKGNGKKDKEHGKKDKERGKKDKEKSKSDKAGASKGKDRSKSREEKGKSKSPKGKDKHEASTGKDKQKASKGKDNAKGRGRSKSPKGKDKSKSPKGKDRSKSSKGKDRSKSPKGKDRSKSPKGKDRSKSPKGKDRSKSPKGKNTSKSPKGKDKAKSPKKSSPKSPKKTPKSPIKGKKMKMKRR